MFHLVVKVLKFNLSYSEDSGYNTLSLYKALRILLPQIHRWKTTIHNTARKKS